ncbi:hypothetical protein BC833DRAFT_624744 [Globomyces pollinis-pini]|nr:hypothetical protein BC833DRAFT_624744 [Globomyces pollinis-pini]
MSSTTLNDCDILVDEIIPKLAGTNTVFPQRDCCSDPSISCSANKRITSISYYNPKFNGFIPPEISKLSYLDYLAISSTSLSGEIPPELFDITSLTIIDLSGNRITGSIPSTVGQMINLNMLHLDDNALSGEIPPSIARATQLESIKLSFNDLSGPIPKMPFPQIHLNDNRFTGPIPVDVGTGDNYLQTLLLQNNQLTGPIPEEMSKFKYLSLFDVTGNKLVGPEPESFSRMENRKSFRIPVLLDPSTTKSDDPNIVTLLSTTQPVTTQSSQSNQISITLTSANWDTTVFDTKFITMELSKSATETNNILSSTLDENFTSTADTFTVDPTGSVSSKEFFITSQSVTENLSFSNSILNTMTVTDSIAETLTNPPSSIVTSLPSNPSGSIIATDSRTPPVGMDTTAATSLSQSISITRILQQSPSASLVFPNTLETNIQNLVTDSNIRPTSTYTDTITPTSTAVAAMPLFSLSVLLAFVSMLVISTALLGLILLRLLSKRSRSDSNHEEGYGSSFTNSISSKNLTDIGNDVVHYNDYKYGSSASSTSTITLKTYSTRKSKSSIHFDRQLSLSKKLSTSLDEEMQMLLGENDVFDSNSTSNVYQTSYEISRKRIGTVNHGSHFYKATFNGRLSIAKVPTSEDEEECIYEESRMMKRLQSPWTVQVLHFMSNESIPLFNNNYIPQSALVMEYMNLGSLTQYLISLDSIQDCDMTPEFHKVKLNQWTVLENRLRICEMIMKGILHMHSLRYVHLNVKPDNILLHHSADGAIIAKISNFHTTRPINSFDGEMIEGAYVPPEGIVSAGQMVMYPKTDKYDIYAFGCTLMHIIFLHDLAALWLQSKRTWLDKKDLLIQSGLSGELLKLILNCINSNPLFRPSAGDVLISLSELNEQDLNHVNYQYSKDMIDENRYAPDGITVGQLMMKRLNLADTVNWAEFIEAFEKSFQPPPSFNKEELKNIISPVNGQISSQMLDSHLFQNSVKSEQWDELVFDMIGSTISKSFANSGMS